MIKVFDRIKEISQTSGTGNFQLQGSPTGFAPFSSVYSNGDVCYYAAVYSSGYEIGSGQYLFNGFNSFLSRYPIASTNINNLVDWPLGNKEIFVTYPAKYSVYTEASPQIGSFATWAGPNTLSFITSPSWTLADSGGNSNAITNATSVTFSGANNIATVFNPALNRMLISGVNILSREDVIITSLIFG